MAHEASDEAFRDPRRVSVILETCLGVASIANAIYCFVCNAEFKPFYRYLCGHFWNLGSI